MRYAFHVAAAILMFLGIGQWQAYSQCVPQTPQNVVSTIQPNGDVLLQWEVTCPANCTNADNTSVLYYIGFYSQQSQAPNGLQLEYGFTTFVAPGCPYTILWDGSSVGNAADPKSSTCVAVLQGIDANTANPGFEESFSVEDICNNTLGSGPGIVELLFDSSSFCAGVTYDIRIWEIEVNVPPNGAITDVDIACNNLYLSESNPASVTGAFTYPGFIAPIAAPDITITGSNNADGTYSGQSNQITISCSDTFSFEYQVTAGCNFTESVAAYFNISPTPTFGAGVNNPQDINQNIEDWWIFFANNIVDNQGNYVPFVGSNLFTNFVVDEDVEVCMLTQDPCNGSSAITCIQFIVVDYDSVFADFDVDFTYSSNCDSLVVDVTSTSVGEDLLLWDFDNGTTSNDSAATAIYTAPGTYEISLIASITGACAKSDTIIKPVSFFPLGQGNQAQFSPTVNVSCDSATVSYQNTSFGQPNYLWDFGNGDTTTSFEPPTQVFFEDTSFTVTLIVVDTNVCGLSDTFSQLVTIQGIGGGVDASFDIDLNYSNDCSSLTVNLTATGTADIHLWDFGDGTTGTGPTTTHTYNNPGDFDVTLVGSLTGTCLKSDTVSQPVSFNPFSNVNIADFNILTQTNCDSIIVTFENNSRGGSYYIWDLGNGNISNDTLPPPQVFTNDTSYDVNLIVVDTNQCEVNDTSTGTVLAENLSLEPEAGFGFIPDIPLQGDLITFIDSSMNADSIFWDFGDGTISTFQNPTHTFPLDLEEYTVCQQVSTTAGCVDSTCKLVRLPNLILDVPTAFSPNDDGSNDLLIVRGENIRTIDFKIFNRWGELVFETNNPNQGWDGTFRNEPQEMDVYIFLLDVTLLNGRSVFRKGNFTLLR